MSTQEITELSHQEMEEVAGGTYGPTINIIIKPKINISFTNKMNLGVLVVAGSTVLKPITFIQIM